MYQAGYDPNTPQWTQPQQAQVTEQEAEQNDMEEGDNSHRPPNAFILYSQAMRSEARQQNPSLSNTEVSRILGKMWKEVPNEVKLQYKQKAAKLQEEFKKNHPDYTYRKARRKRALNELLTKSTQGYPGSMPIFPGMDQMQFMMMQNANSMPGYQQMGGQAGQQMINQIPGYPPQMPMMPGMPSSGQMGGMDQQMAAPIQGMGQQPNAMYGQMGQYPPQK
ncbi:Transcription factor SOX-17 [Tritrichomonas musculus]|uniref:Transcription factor SOX-17 n=1 Tax=Tritrichomonas musculus TaxID=1915356 RepID=A0ABR2KU71_9EUKA